MAENGCLNHFSRRENHARVNLVFFRDVSRSLSKQCSVKTALISFQT